MSRDNASPTCVLTGKERSEFYQDRVFRARVPAGSSLLVRRMILKCLEFLVKGSIAQFPEKQRVLAMTMKPISARPRM